MTSRDISLFGGAALFVAALTFLIRVVAIRHGVLDVPNQRSSHVTVTPRGGGLAIVVCVLTALAWLCGSRLLPTTAAALFGLGGAAVATIGYIDDIRGLPALPRFIVHIAASILAVAAHFYISGNAPLEYDDLLIAAVLVVCATWSINLFNFMDGTDGIAASQAVFLCIAIAILLRRTDSVAIGWLSLLFVTAGASIGFLVWNWPPARIFMGDVGSGFLGYWLAAMAFALDAADILSIWTFVILNALFIGDATATVGRRILSGERWYEAHRSHAYQILARRWHSHRRVTLLAWIVNVVALLPAAYASIVYESSAPALALGVLAVVMTACLAVGAGSTEQPVEA